KYHATTKAGYRNSKWNGASPSDTQSYLTGLWARIRAKLHREEIRIFGIRVAEPHHDGTPHWHMLMFMVPEDVERVRLIIRDYAWEEDRHELRSDKAKKARFHAEAIDPEKGSATGYVAKYISKNIDGYALDGELDDESGELLKETAPAVSAWAARWHIRQFQFVGGAPVTVYRELRRLADTETAHGLSVEFAAVHDAADAGDWAGYVNAQGGPFVRRDDLQVRTLYEPRTEFNQYGEETVCIRGVYDSAIGVDTPILTRLTQWKIVPKRAVDLAVDLQGAPAPSRSSVNNCTGRSASDEKQPSEMAVPADKTAPDDSSGTELPLNIEDLRRYSRQQRQEITSRLRKSARESSDQAFARTARGLRTSIDDETALAWGPKVTAAKDMSLTPEEAERRWCEQLRIEAERRADNYAAAVAEYQKKKAEAALRQAQQKEATQKRGIPEEMIISIGAQLRDCRIFVSDEVVRSVAGGARVRHGGGLLEADNGRLREVKVWRAGEKDKPTSEYMAVRDLVTRWKKAAKRKNER
ncbi:MAG: replication endonuclease, partial [Klebsiella sp.]|nr:replication endonuclease [Klebsiella sp.]